jgi:hypothetical protein
VTTVELARELLARLEAAAGADAPTGQPSQGCTAVETRQTGNGHVGVQVDSAELAALVQLAGRMGLPPGLVLKMALAALARELVTKEPRRMVGKERGVLEGER